MSKFIHNVLQGAEKAHAILKDKAMLRRLQNTRTRFEKYEMADDQDIALMSELLGIYIIIFGKSGSALQTVGDPTSSKMEVNNECSVDGSGNRVPHFRFLWRPDKQQPEDDLEEASC